MKYTRQAFQILPKINEPYILDVGCGSGIPTIELAKLSKGTIVSVDTDHKELEKLDKKILEEGLSNRVSTQNCSILDVDFPDETFDIIWAEGSLHIVGFEKSLNQLRHLLRKGGFIVAHDGINHVSSALISTSDLGYSLIDHFILPDDEWKINYFEPLERLIKKWKKNPENSEIVKTYQNQVNMFRKKPEENISGFYIFQKNNC
ncbi:MAG: class I SAM-dependent methyltransferase [Candidatus Bathyarchaeum tardum]|nr:MAG: class I SAM-dependent methyltransferase [Candidatus Bathyarchaeum tardum]